MSKTIKKLRLNVETAKVKISVNRVTEKHKTEEKSRSIIVRIARVILLPIWDFIG